MATTELGIWSDAAGGFIDAGLYSEDEAEAAIVSLVADGETQGDLSVIEVCPEHQEQPKDGCEECAADDDDDEQDDQE